jgi:hypothetical protein
MTGQGATAKAPRSISPSADRECAAGDITGCVAVLPTCKLSYPFDSSEEHDDENAAD